MSLLRLSLVILISRGSLNILLLLSHKPHLLLLDNHRLLTGLVFRLSSAAARAATTATNTDAPDVDDESADHHTETMEAKSVSNIHWWNGEETTYTLAVTPAKTPNTTGKRISFAMLPRRRAQLLWLGPWCPWRP